MRPVCQPGTASSKSLTFSASSSPRRRFCRWEWIHTPGYVPALRRSRGGGATRCPRRGNPRAGRDGHAIGLRPRLPLDFRTIVGCLRDRHSKPGEGCPRLFRAGDRTATGPSDRSPLSSNRSRGNRPLVVIQLMIPSMRAMPAGEGLDLVLAAAG